MKSVALLLKRTPNNHPVVQWLQSADCDVRLYPADDVHTERDRTRHYEQWKSNSSLEFDVVRDHETRPFDAIVALSECDQVRVAELRQYLGIPGQQPASTLACRDKVSMKTIAAAAHIPVPRFQRVGSIAELIDLLDEFGPVVVKPVDGAGSLGVAVLSTPPDALRWAEDQGRLSDDPANYLVEEYIEAPMLPVHGLSQRGDVVFSHVGSYTTTCPDSVTRGLPHGILSTDRQDRRTEVAQHLSARVVAALPPSSDLRSFHIELFDHPGRGLLLCEIACRTGGGLLSDEVEHGESPDWQAHQTLVPTEVCYQVQSVLTARKSAVEATQIHDHYLKGTIHCGGCGSRLIVFNAKNRHSNVYCYFVCSGRHSKRTNCDRRAILITDVEKLIEDYYQRIQITPAQHEALAGMLHHEFDQLMSTEVDELAQLTANRDRLHTSKNGSCKPTTPTRSRLPCSNANKTASWANSTTSASASTPTTASTPTPSPGPRTQTRPEPPPTILLARVRALCVGWKQWSAAGTGDHGSRGLFPGGIKASAWISTPRSRAMTR